MTKSSDDNNIFREFIDKIKDFKVLDDDKHNPFDNKNIDIIDSQDKPKEHAEQSSDTHYSHEIKLSEHLWRPLVSAEDYLFYFQSGVQNRTIRKLRAGKMRIEATLDLHQLNKEQAKTEFANFIEAGYNQEYRCICVIHGKGYRSDASKPILKNLVNHWLQEINTVIGYCSCPQNMGGTGAVLILLKRNISI